MKIEFTAAEAKYDERFEMPKDIDAVDQISRMAAEARYDILTNAEYEELEGFMDKLSEILKTRYVAKYMSR